MGISSSKDRMEEVGNMNLEIGIDTTCPLKYQFLYSNIESLSKCITDVRGFRANSASPSDIYQLTFNNPPGTPNNLPRTAIMKLFLVNDPLNFLRNGAGNLELTLNQTFQPAVPGTPVLNNTVRMNSPLQRTNYEAQVYELIIYLEKIKKLVDYNICPYFVKVLGGNVNISAQKIWNYVLNGRGINIRNFIRNIVIMRFSLVFNLLGSRFNGANLNVQGRPAIGDNINNVSIQLNGPTLPNIRASTIRRNIGLPAVSGVLYTEQNVLDYGIVPIDLNAVKTGYILTEQVTSPNLNDILTLIKLVGANYGGFRNIAEILRDIENNIRNGTITTPIFDNLKDEIRNILTLSDMDTSKLVIKLNEINNLVQNYLNNPTNANRDSSINALRMIRYFSPNEQGNTIVKNAIFQLLIATYSLFLSGVAHNDLHSGNVFLEILNYDRIINYYINGSYYVIRTRCFPKIYDFDRAYVQGYDNRLLFDNMNSQNNVLLNPKDFIKILCYIRGFNISPEVQNYIRLVVNRPTAAEQNNVLDNFYAGNGCFLQVLDPATRLPVRSADRQSDFDVFHNYRDLINIMEDGRRQTIQNHVYNNDQRYYFLDSNFFVNNDIVDSMQIEKYILQLGLANNNRIVIP